MKKWEIEFQEDQVVRIGDNNMLVKKGDVLRLDSNEKKQYANYCLKCSSFRSDKNIINLNNCRFCHSTLDWKEVK